jgi:hypothetical protein
MAKIDENQEAIARIRTALDNYDKAIQEQQPTDDEVPDTNEYSQFNLGQCLWAFGAPEKTTTAASLEQGIFAQHPDALLRHLDARLRSFLRTHISVDCIPDGVPLVVRI